MYFVTGNECEQSFVHTVDGGITEGSFYDLSVRQRTESKSTEKVCRIVLYDCDVVYLLFVLAPETVEARVRKHIHAVVTEVTMAWSSPKHRSR